MEITIIGSWTTSWPPPSIVRLIAGIKLVEVLGLSHQKNEENIKKGSGRNMETWQNYGSNLIV